MTLPYFSPENANEEKLKTAFLDEYEELCRKHGVMVCYAMAYGMMLIRSDDLESWIADMRKEVMAGNIHTV